MAINPSHARVRPSLLVIDPQKFLFSLSSCIAAIITLGIAFAASLPRPWWALLTVYVTAQPMSGSFRPKVFYRLGGILLGAIVTVVLVPNLQNSPELLVLCLAGWTGLCLYFAVLDRTPRAFLFQMAGFSAAVIAFPYVDDPGQIFTTTISRVEEMTVAIVSVTLVHGILQPWTVTPIIRERAETFLRDAAEWTIEALDTRHTRLEYEHRKRLAADITELGMMAIHLPSDTLAAGTTRWLVGALQERLALLLPLASAAANRLDMLRIHHAIEPDLMPPIEAINQWLSGPIDSPPEVAAEIAARCRTLACRYDHGANWDALLTASLCERMAEFVEAQQESRLLVYSLENTVPTKTRPRFPKGIKPRPFPMARDHTLPILSGLATAAAIIIYCTIWIALEWPAGAATAAFAALITCSFAAQEDPAPQIRRYLGATLVTFPLAAFYNFVILPCVDGYMMLSLVLAPALLAIGYIQADPARSALALPMFSCLIVALGFLDRFQADFGVFVNVGLAQVGGIITTIAVTRLFRSVGTRWVAHRMIRGTWRDLAALANSRQRLDSGVWTSRAIDRLGQIAARMALAAPGDALHGVDGLADLRVGRNLLHLRRAADFAAGEARRAINQMLDEIAEFFRRRAATGTASPPAHSLLRAIDAALMSIPTLDQDALRHQAILALVGVRCNLFPAASAYVPSETSPRISA